MTLTYFMARSAEVAYPRSQVSIYRSIGPLVLVFGQVWHKQASIIIGDQMACGLKFHKEEEVGMYYPYVIKP